ALADAPQENPQHLAVERDFENAIFIAGVDIGVIVDFDNVAAIADLPEVDAVEPIADDARGLHRRLHDDLRRLANGERDRGALQILPRLALDDLPVSRRHQIFAD